MKKSILLTRTSFFAALLLVCTVSCTRDPESASLPELKFRAVMPAVVEEDGDDTGESSSKVYLSGLRTQWNGNEVIYIYDGKTDGAGSVPASRTLDGYDFHTGYTYQAVQGSEQGRYLSFEARSSGVPVADIYYAVHPRWSADYVFTAGGIAWIWLPRYQVGVKGNFSLTKGATTYITAWSVAKCTRSAFGVSDLQFRHITAILKFTIPDAMDEKICAIKFQGLNNEYPAGDILLDVSDDDNWTYQYAKKDPGVNNKAVTLYPDNIVGETPDPSTTFKAGSYYMNILPLTFSKGIKVTMYYTEDGSTKAEYTRTHTGSCPFAMGTLYDMGEVNTTLYQK